MSSTPKIDQQVYQNTSKRTKSYQNAPKPTESYQIGTKSVPNRHQMYQISPKYLNNTTI